MNGNLKMNEFAALTAAVVPAAEKVSSGAALRLATTVRPKTLVDLAQDFSRAELLSVRLPQDPELATSPEPLQPAVMDHLLRSIGQEATIVRREQPESLAVVLKPDSRTEIFVRLHMREGGLEAEARCERGDFQFLNTHWAELQRSLAQHGVRLRELQPNPDSLAFGSGSMRSGSEHRDPSRFAAADEASLCPASASVQKPRVSTAPGSARLLCSNRLLESWA